MSAEQAAGRDPERVLILGNASRSGTYLLRIRVEANLRLAFGGFRRGKILAVPAGEYVYVGSALSRIGAAPLGRRLVRHATRTGTKPAHAIRDEIVERFRATGLGDGGLLPKSPKCLHWNIDHLLDQETVELVGVIAIRSENRLERELGRWIEHDPATEILAKGLGANDVPGNTHLLRVNAGDAWWDALPERLASPLTAWIKAGSQVQIRTRRP